MTATDTPFTKEQLHWFNVLDMAPSRSVHDVQLAFLKMAKRYHPDKNPSLEGQHRFHSATAAREKILAFLRGDPGKGMSPVLHILDKTGIVIPLSLCFHGGKYKVPGIGHDVYVTVPAGSISRGPVILEDGTEYVVNIHVEDDGTYRRKGYDLHYDASIPVMDAVLGSVLDVKLLDGATFRLMIQAGTGEDVMLKIRGRGLPRPGKEPGDLFVHLKLQLPSTLSEDQRAVAEVFRSLLEGKPLSELLMDDRPGLAKLARRFMGR